MLIMIMMIIIILFLRIYIVTTVCSAVYKINVNSKYGYNTIQFKTRGLELHP